MAQAIIGIKEVRRPISQEIKGYRMVAVVPNKAKWNQRRKKWVTSYEKKWIIAERGDYIDYPRIDQITKFAKDLKGWHMINEVEFEY